MQEVGEAWDLAKLGFDPPISWSLSCQVEGGQPSNKPPKSEPYPLDSCLPSLFPPPLWDHLEGHIHPWFWLPWLPLAPDTGGQGGVCPDTHSGVLPVVFLFYF